ncbi:hypothetical protein GCM10010363_61000 [Streptomyces omiyaensis]|nr:hypothetical protein GCM10010363_61000 [Streptomyces omiyaensis]
MDAIETFLDSHAEAQRAAHPPETAEHRMASTVRGLVRQSAWDARKALDFILDDEHFGAYGKQADLKELHRLKCAWSVLVKAAVPWQGEAGHDTNRWRSTEFTDRSEEEAAERERVGMRAAVKAMERRA